MSLTIQDNIIRTNIKSRPHTSNISRKIYTCSQIGTTKRRFTYKLLNTTNIFIFLTNQIICAKNSANDSLIIPLFIHWTSLATSHPITIKISYCRRNYCITPTTIILPNQISPTRNCNLAAH